jgi:hypothetical protein
MRNHAYLICKLEMFNILHIEWRKIKIQKGLSDSNYENSLGAAKYISVKLA